MKLTPEQQALKQAALAATQGQWASLYEGGGDHIVTCGDHTDDDEIAVCSGPSALSAGDGFEKASANAAYIAAANPAVVLALLAQIEAMP